VAVTSAPDGTPRDVTIEGVRRGVMTVRDDWLVQDLWWTDRAVDRHYFELVLDSGRLVVVYREAAGGAWFSYG
jgi:hypothetical protein